MELKKFNVRKLDKIFKSAVSQSNCLSLAEISGFEELHSFFDLRNYVIDLSYPAPQADKLETFGWAPTLYHPRDRTFTGKHGKFTRYGCWRSGAAEHPDLSVFYADVDNANPDQPHVSMEEVAGRLKAVAGPLCFFMYTTFSHTAQKPKFRVVIETDRDITRSEMLRLAVYLNWTAFGRQADLSIYDPGDFVFAPPHQPFVMDHLQGVPIDVSAMLGQQIALQATEPDSVAGALRVKASRVSKSMTKGGLDPIAVPARDMSVRAEKNTSNPDVFNPVWGELYRDRVVGGSHWETMRAVLGKVWAKSGGDLTYGELELLFGEIDALDGGYILGKYGETKRDELLDWLSAVPVEPRVPEWHPILDQEDAGVVIGFKDAECGEGKTRDELERMIREKGRYIYVVPQINDMADRKLEFQILAGRLAAYRFYIKEAHSKERELKVALQLLKLRSEIATKAAGTPVIIFVTQQAALMMDWSGWNDFEIIFDEVPEIFATYSMRLGRHAELFRTYISTDGKDGECYKLKLTTAGRELALRHATSIDDYDAVHYGLTLMLAKKNSFAWVKASDWDSGGDVTKLEFFAICSPQNLEAFKSVRMLGDELLKSSTATIWGTKYGVEFSRVEFPKRKRQFPTKDRVKIFYFSEHRDSSKTRFKEGDVPLKEISEFIKSDSGEDPVLWTTNEAVSQTVNLAEEHAISPKSHGRNDLSHYRRVAWLAAMKASKFEIGSLKDVCGMTSQQLTDWREYNAMYQFVMRSNLRDFDSAAPVVVYVFSKKQAEYLKSRLGGDIQRVPDIIVDERPRCLDPDGPMTGAERVKIKYWKDKTLEAGVTDVRQLPASKSLTKLNDREIGLINSSLAKAANDGDRAEAA